MKILPISLVLALLVVVQLSAASYPLRVVGDGLRKLNAVTAKLVSGDARAH